MKIEHLRLKIENFKISIVLFVSSLFPHKLKSGELTNKEFPTSAQKMGICFTDRIRDIFRHKWIKTKNSKFKS